jgi:hypothetical protein
MTDGRDTPDPESFEPDLEAWDAWRPEDVSALLAEVRTT